MGLSYTRGTKWGSVAYEGLQEPAGGIEMALGGGTAAPAQTHPILNAPLTVHLQVALL